MKTNRRNFLVAIASAVVGQRLAAKFWPEPLAAGDVFTMAATYVPTPVRAGKSVARLSELALLRLDLIIPGQCVSINDMEFCRLTISDLTGFPPEVLRSPTLTLYEISDADLAAAIAPYYCVKLNQRRAREIQESVSA